MCFTGGTLAAMLEFMSPHTILTEAELHKAVAHTAPFAHAFDLLQEHVIITDGDAHILYANTAAEKATGFSLSEMLGKNPADLWGGHMSKDFYQRMWQRIHHEHKPFSDEIRNIRKDGEEIWQELRISPVLDSSGKVEFFIAVESVMTERKNKELAHEDIISVISHEALSPLTAIRWTLERALSGQKPSAAQKNLQVIEEQSARLVSLVEDLTFLSRFGKGHPDFEEVDLATEWIQAGNILSEMSPHLSFAAEGTARTHAVRSLVAELLRSMAEEISKAMKPKTPVTLVCTISATKYEVTLTLSVPAKEAAEKEIDLRTAHLIARYLRWEGPVFHIHNNSLQWIFQFPL
jgi:PAS domain S-box-containing protein